MRYVRRFFDQIHSMYWFYSSEQFYAQLDRTLQDGGTTASASWLCSLYSIFALGSMRSRDEIVPNRGLPQDSMEANDYLTMAKELSPKAADEADIESVRAFGLLVSVVAESSPIECGTEFCRASPVMVFATVSAHIFISGRLLR